MLAQTGVHKIVIAQSVLVLSAGAGFYGYQGIAPAYAALFGGFIALLNVITGYYWVRGAAQMALTSSGQGSEVLFFYVGAAQRFVTTILLFAVGMVWLKLAPIPLLMTFALAQLGYLFKSYADY